MSIILFSFLSPNTEKRLYFLYRGLDSLLIGLRLAFVLKEEGRVRLVESSMYSEKLRATLDLIFHISTCLLGFTPSDHLSASSRRFPMLQFHDFGTMECRNFSKPDFSLLPIILRICSLSLRNYLIDSDTNFPEFREGSLSTNAFGWFTCICLIAATWV